MPINAEHLRLMGSAPLTLLRKIRFVAESDSALRDLLKDMSSLDTLKAIDVIYTNSFGEPLEEMIMDDDIKEMTKAILLRAFSYVISSRETQRPS